MRSRGRSTSEDVGISNENFGENPKRRKSKVSWGRFVRPGLAGPKARAKAVVDGEQVDIPAPLQSVMSNGGTQEAKYASDRKCSYKHVGWPGRQIRRAIPEV